MEILFQKELPSCWYLDCNARVCGLVRTAETGPLGRVLHDVGPALGQLGGAELGDRYLPRQQELGRGHEAGLQQQM